MLLEVRTDSIRAFTAEQILQICVALMFDIRMSLADIGWNKFYFILCVVSTLEFEREKYTEALTQY